ncbi:DUF6578 domain-containing protein [Streptomyces tritici]|uniref:DUF6578 domain-containing protein n=1 Tax=Streptomyces tritici TaxID=2054410 RepID=UPI003AF04AD8
MTVTVWVDDWQMQCCGESFGPGDVVSWELIEADPEDYADLVGDEVAAGIGFREEHHGQGAGDAPVALEVVGVDEVHCRYEVSSRGGGVSEPVPGTTEFVPVERADGWAKTRAGVRFAGYLVTARPVGEGPGR